MRLADRPSSLFQLLSHPVPGSVPGFSPGAGGGYRRIPKASGGRKLNTNSHLTVVTGCPRRSPKVPIRPSPRVRHFFLGQRLAEFDLDVPLRLGKNPTGLFEVVGSDG